MLSVVQVAESRAQTEFGHKLKWGTNKVVRKQSWAQTKLASSFFWRRDPAASEMPVPGRRTRWELELVNSFINDPLAVSLGEVLQTNTTITHLNAETNQIATAGMEVRALYPVPCALMYPVPER